MLGHRWPDFTLRFYARLIPGDTVEPLDLDAELPPAVPRLIPMHPNPKRTRWHRKSLWTREVG